MVRITLGEKGRRLKWHIYSLGIFLLVLLLTCQILRHVDWSSVQRTELEKQLREEEEKIVLQDIPIESKARKLLGRCNLLLRNRWLTGYLYCEQTGRGYFIGRLSPQFRKAVEAQKKAIDAGGEFDRKRIPKLRMVVEFKKIHCRLLVAEVPPRQ